MRVWVTRAEPGASATAGRLRALGHTPLVSPLLAVRALPGPAGAPPGVGALAFTSANGVRAFRAWSGMRDRPVFAVGEATAKAAREAGFEEVVCAQGGVAELADAIVRAAPVGLVLHPSAVERAGDLQGLLAARAVEAATLPLYETRATEVLPPAVDQALGSGVLDAVLVHSPRAGRVLAALLPQRVAFEPGRLRAIGLSSACLEPLATLGFAEVCAAASPDEDALLDRLG